MCEQLFLDVGNSVAPAFLSVNAQVSLDIGDSGALIAALCAHRCFQTWWTTEWIRRAPWTCHASAWTASIPQWGLHQWRPAGESER
jgi:hypothetical protein